MMAGDLEVGGEVDSGPGAGGVFLSYRGVARST
jgi:hypothetical protein